MSPAYVFKCRPVKYLHIFSLVCTVTVKSVNITYRKVTSAFLMYETTFILWKKFV